MTYNWASNILKLQRAIAASGVKTEKDIKRLYVEYGGHVKPGYEVVEEVVKQKPEAIIESPIESITVTPEEVKG